MGNALGLLLTLAMPFMPVPAAPPAAEEVPPPAAGPSPPQAPAAVQQAVDPSSPPSEPPPAVAAESDLLSARRTDPAIDQAWISPTAFTQPRGTISVETHDLMLLTSSIGVIDRLQLTVRVVPSYFAGDWFLSGGFKLHVLSTERSVQLVGRGL